MQHLSHCIYKFFLIFLLAIYGGQLYADPPTSVARIGFLSGQVSFSPAQSNDWVQAKLNRPSSSGDHFWVDRVSKLELQLPYGQLEVDELTDITIFNLDRSISQFQLTQGSINLELRAQQDNPQEHTFEIDTPNVAFVTKSPGNYRIDVDETGTMISIREGDAQVYGEKNAYQLDAGTAYFFTGTDLQNEIYALASLDAFDQWSAERNLSSQRAQSSNFVSPQTVGYEDLDHYGDWQDSDDYGPIWVPRETPDDWAPYRDGEWEWIPPWGWTWIDQAPWGFAPFHYGRWAFIDEAWAWVPGPQYANVPPVYSPAMVAFLNMGDVNTDFYQPGNDVAWVPLAPGDVYIPPYPVTQTYFTNVNVSNTVINNTYIANVYNNPAAVINYRNKYLRHAITVVPQNTFVSGKAVSKAIVPLPENINPAKIRNLQKPPVTPTALSAIGTTPAARVRPPRSTQLKPVIVKTNPLNIRKPGQNTQTMPLIKPASTTNTIRSLKPASLQAIKPAPRPAELRRIERLKGLHAKEPTTNLITPSKVLVPSPVNIQHPKPLTINPATPTRPSELRRIERLKNVAPKLLQAPKNIEPKTMVTPERPAVLKHREHLQNIETQPVTIYPQQHPNNAYQPNVQQPIERPAVQRHREHLQNIETQPQAVTIYPQQHQNAYQPNVQQPIERPAVQRHREHLQNIETQPVMSTPIQTAPVIAPPPRVHVKTTTTQQPVRPSVQRRLERQKAIEQQQQ